MNLNQRNQGGVGRGALLRRLAQQAASSNSNSDESSSNISTSTSIESLPTTSADTSGVSSANPTQSQGRGRLLQRILNAQESVSNDLANLELAPRPFGRGRMLQFLTERGQEIQPVMDVSQSDDNAPSTDEGVESLSEQSREEEPVIRMGTSGWYSFDSFVRAPRSDVHRIF